MGLSHRSRKPASDDRSRMDSHMACEGLRVHCKEFLGGGFPTEATDEIRIYVPLGTRGAFIGEFEKAPGERVETLVSTPQVWITPPNQLVAVTCLGPMRVAMLALEREFCERELSSAGVEPREVVDRVAAYDERLRAIGNVFGAAIRVCWPPEPEYVARVARELAVHVSTRYGRLAKHPRAGGLSPERLARVTKLVEGCLSKPFHVDELAAEAHMSPFHFARMFKRSTGYSPHLYLTLKRMDRAKEMLAGTPIALAELAQQLGYSTQAHFTGVFRSYTGTTPRAYRARFRKKTSAQRSL